MPNLSSASAYKRKFNYVNVQGKKCFCCTPFFLALPLLHSHMNSFLLFDESKSVDSNLCNLTNNKLTETLFNGSSLFNINQNRFILHSTIT